MGVYIKGMNMPTSCEECQTVLGCIDGSEGGTVWCRLAHGYIGDERTVCTLVPVPPHGDLVDVNDLLHDKQGQKLFRGDFRMAFNQIIERAPTIIPAEEG